MKLTQPIAVALGTFDGLHLGHRAVLSMPESHRRFAVTFAEPPRNYFGANQKLLMTSEEKTAEMKKAGITPVLLDFDRVRSVLPTDFLENIFGQLTPSFLSCGFNYRFGKDGAGDIDLLERFCREKGITLSVKEPETIGGEVISSSGIRTAIAKGELVKANAMLGREFGFSATVIQGNARGRTIGFPTVNQRYPAELVSPKDGVYETKITVGNKVYKGITDIGNRPTFPLDYKISETHILDYSGDLYGQTVTTQLVRFLRPERKFNSLEELVSQIKRDVESLKE